MIEIKFRAWDKENKVMIQGDDLAFEEYLPLAELFQDCDLTFMQYTGVLDINGVEIYEGDVIKVIEDYTRDDVFEPFVVGEVKFNYGSFYVDDGCIKRYDWSRYVYEVVGNVYENQELPIF